MSVRKRKWRKPSGEIREAWVCEYTDAIGKRRRKTFTNKKAAEHFEAQARVDIKAGIFTADSVSRTVAQASVLWLKSCEQRGLEVTTIDSYRQSVNYHIVPLLGHQKLTQLSAPVIRQFEDNLRDGSIDNKTRSSAMVRKIRASLSMILNDAQERGLVNRNVVRELSARRMRGGEKRLESRHKGKLKVGVDIPLPAEISKILLALESTNPRHRSVITTAIFSGLRASELRGLRWQDISFNRCEIEVKQRADRYNKIGPLKSAAAERSVPMPPIAMNILRNWKLQCPKSKLALVFPTRSGTVTQLSDIVNRGLKPAQVKASVLNADGKPKYSGMHALRHFFASWCINRKTDGGLELPLKIVQERMGHSSIQMTADRYGHLFPRGDDHEELTVAEAILWSA